MQYLKAYIEALGFLLRWSAITYFCLAIWGDSLFAYYFLYLSLVSAVAGPVKKWLFK